ncbi:sigma-70 family RNA polymerase sigma factor [Dactylosporangium vinaceum]|uniref:RNA polymerase sigma factor n=1 Tax=Dactylosporangium vinaceum TaxID=53362 RepID=A0ABV5MQF3_9ACTN|nr:sigma-70 family RNA polymerase sigma factor [Dactylosporangium vinaceum]UAB96473.1 sigma-70 family RNA polymerase sigma factor [Dactylosporangium vinaceum]
MIDKVPEFARSPEAFEAFYREHINAVQRFIARRVDDPHTAADLTADVFLAVIDSAHTYRPDRGPLLPWLYGVAHNVVAAERRRATREHDAGRRIAGRRLLDPSDIARLEERIDAESKARQVYSALADVPHGTRRIIELVAVDGLTIAEAAAALGISPVLARVRLHRARLSIGVNAHGYA